MLLVEPNLLVKYINSKLTPLEIICLYSRADLQAVGKEIDTDKERNLKDKFCRNIKGVSAKNILRFLKIEMSLILTIHKPSLK